ncbi:MAG: folylpolyglutamate synthase/dihydrofolate synthase family protein [Pseudomonadota bacterium]
MDQSPAILERLLSLHPRRMDLSLGRMQRLLERLGNPENRLPPIVHVAGTNGKGSTIATMRGILDACGQRVHVYTSPHLVAFRERIRLGGTLVSDEDLSRALVHCETVNDGDPITFFEITTAAAFLLFSEKPADILLLEVGLGGRLDATNVVPDPAVSVITAISMDHEQWLGDTLEAIAGEKAGIIRKNVPVVTAPQPDPVRDVIAAHADRVGAPARFGGQDWIAREESGRLVVEDGSGLVDLPLPRLRGQHQIDNAGVAVTALKTAGLLPVPDRVEAGILATEWPARLQRLQSQALSDLAPADSELWLDGGHNPDAGQAAANFMADLEERAPRPLFLIAGMLNTKDPIPYFKAFNGLVRHVYTVPISGAEASYGAESLSDSAFAAGLASEPFADVRSALAFLKKTWDYGPPRILICGSLYLAGEVLGEFGPLPD